MYFKISRWVARTRADTCVLPTMVLASKLQPSSVSQFFVSWVHHLFHCHRFQCLGQYSEKTPPEGHPSSVVQLCESLKRVIADPPEIKIGKKLESNNNRLEVK